MSADGQEFSYHHLIVALGGEPAYFGITGVEEHVISTTGIGTAEMFCSRVIERYVEATLARGEVPPLEANLRRHRRQGHRGREGLRAARADPRRRRPRRA